MTTKLWDRLPANTGNGAFNWEHFDRLLRHADIMLNMSPQGIAKEYADHTVYVVQCHEKGEMDEHVEVYFEIEGASLATNFDKDNKCESISILLCGWDDSVNSCEIYVDHLNAKFLHIEGQFCWKMSLGILTMMIDNNRISFVRFRDLEVPSE